MPVIVSAADHELSGPVDECKSRGAFASFG